MNTKKLSKRGFTLVELIIVIAIIAILAVTAFLLLTKRLAKARDASRSSNLANIENSLQISLTENSSLPKPDNYTLIYASGTTNIVGYQGDFGEGVKDSVGNINSAPKDGDDYFTYYLDSSLKTYQLGAFMENETAYNPNTVNAIDYSDRYFLTKGWNYGIFTDTATNVPVNKLGLTGIDVINTTNTYKIFFDASNTLQGSGSTLKSMRGGGNGIIGYRSFDEGNGTTLHDTMGKNVNGIITGTTVFSGGKVGSGLYFDGGTGWVDFTNLVGLTSSGGAHTISAWVKPNSIPNCGNNSCRQWILNLGAGMGAHHWIFGGEYSSQFGIWNGPQSEIEISANVWNHIVVTRDGNKITGYLNGIKSSTIEHSSILTKFINLGSYNLNLGKRQNSAEKYFSGALDELVLYNTALSDSDVLKLYNSYK